MRDVAPLYEMSTLQLRCACLRLSYDALECLLWGPGEEAGAQVLSFEQALIDRCSGQIAIDGHAIGTRFWEGDLADKGYKFVKLGEEQANLLMALDVNTAIPFMSCFYEGGCLRDDIHTTLLSCGTSLSAVLRQTTIP
ncbi:hypothetical protein [Atopobium sp. oral taxon 416]|uniref:hypothetical protein n=1 Tax=Atopobium sp. oral taxon 416 TaxID=712157 RepID=UPI001BADCA48|nr:hypothetical protein [Atopobium sp. oral taxon 416]QUC03346.1 hypothetical protein J4859_15495 [Atopobium sp. oral taxon 416]